jgi:hypothetical protein
MIRRICMHEIKLGEQIAANRLKFPHHKHPDCSPYYEARMMTHKPGGARQRVWELYGPRAR